MPPLSLAPLVIDSPSGGPAAPADQNRALSYFHKVEDDGLQLDVEKLLSLVRVWMPR